jgi:microcystin degradation protein MlrC
LQFAATAAFPEAACIAAQHLQKALTTGILPKQQCLVTPLMWPPTGTATANDPMLTLESMAREMEKRLGVESVSVVAGFSFADTEHTGVSFVASGSDEAQISRCLQELADKAHELRELGNVVDPPLAEVMSRLPSFTSGLTVLVEPSDNIGGGASGDGTGLLRALIEHEVVNSAICIADPVSSEKARVAGIGARVTLSIGGKGSRLDAGPVDLEVEVISLSDGRFELEDKQSHLASMCGDRFDMGPCAVVRYSGITILLTGIKTPPFDLGQWRSQGIEPSALSVIAVKAAVAHRRAYDPIAARMLWVDTPGPCSSNLKTLPYHHLRRPIFPLDS